MSVCTDECECMHVYMNECVCVDVRVCSCVYVRVCVFMCIRSCVCVRVYKSLVPLRDTQAVKCGIGCTTE